MLQRKKIYMDMHHPNIAKSSIDSLNNIDNGSLLSKSAFHAPIYPFGQPLNQFSGLMLSNKWNMKQDVSGWLMSEKFDGVRCFWSGSELYTRTGVVIKAPAFFTKDFPRSPLDGELYIGKNSYEETVKTIMNGKKDHEGWLKMSFIVFDAPSINLGFKHRLNMLEKVFKSGTILGFIRLVDYLQCKNNEHVEGKSFSY